MGSAKHDGGQPLESLATLIQPPDRKAKGLEGVFHTFLKARRFAFAARLSAEFLSPKFSRTYIAGHGG